MSKVLYKICLYTNSRYSYRIGSNAISNESHDDIFPLVPSIHSITKLIEKTITLLSQAVTDQFYSSSG